MFSNVQSQCAPKGWQCMKLACTCPVHTSCIFTSIWRATFICRYMVPVVSTLAHVLLILQDGKTFGTVHCLCKDYSHELRFQLWVWKLPFNTPIAKVSYMFISPSTLFGIIQMFVNISCLVYPNSNCHLINDKLSGHLETFSESTVLHL